MDLRDIKKAIVKKLKTLNVNVVADDIRSGFEKPAFFVQLQFFNRNNSKNLSDTLITFNIHYFSKEKTDLDNIKMLDKLNDLFVDSLDVDGDIFTLENIEGEIYDNVLQFKFDLKITELAIEDESEYEKMQKLFFRSEVE